jgi:hypothetical protein
MGAVFIQKHDLGPEFTVETSDGFFQMCFHVKLEVARVSVVFNIHAKKTRAIGDGDLEFFKQSLVNFF